MAIKTFDKIKYCLPYMPGGVVALCCRVLQYVAVCCSVLQCAVVCCSVLQCVAVCYSLLYCLVAIKASDKIKYHLLFMPVIQM